MRTRNFLITVIVAACFIAGCSTTPGRFTERARGLESTSADVRRESANDLRSARVTDPERRAPLVRRLAVMAQSDPEPLVRSAALSALIVQDPETALDVAKRIRTDTDDMVRWDAVKVIARLGDASTVPILLGVLRDDTSSDARREAARALARYDEPRVIDALITALSDEDLSVAHAARTSLVQLSSGFDFGMKPGPWRMWWTPPPPPAPDDDHQPAPPAQ